MKTSMTALAALLLFAGQAARAAPLRVVTTIETLGDLARRVGGDRVAVQSLSHGYNDPHFVEGKPNLVLVLNRADLLVRVGLELEVGWLPPLVTTSRNERIQPGAAGDLDASQFISLLDLPTVKVDRSMGDIHPMGNPHYWIPPVNAVRIAKGITERLKQLRPEDGAYFDGQFQKFLAEVKAHAPAWEAAAKPLAGLRVVTYHKSWSYVSQWLKLREMGYLEDKPGISPSPAHLTQLILMMRAQRVAAILVEDFYNRAVAQDVAGKASATVLAMPSDVGATPHITTYFELVDAVLRSLGSVSNTP